MNSLLDITRDYCGRNANGLRNLIQLLGVKWYGQFGTSPCSICQPNKQSHQNALTLRLELDGDPLLHCRKRDCAFVDVLAVAGRRRSYGLAEAKLNASSGNTALLLKDLDKCNIAFSTLWAA